MKKLEFETSKGRFILIDQEPCGKVVLPSCSHIEIGRLKQITEEQASEIVDNPINGNFYPKYGNFEGYSMWYCLVDKPIESLHSLLKSKGINLFTTPYLPNEYFEDDEAFISDFEERKKTFYNPVIFKL